MSKNLLFLTAMDKEGISFTEKHSFEISNDQLLIPEIPAQIFKKNMPNGNSVIFIIAGKCPRHGVNRIGPHIHALALAALSTFRPALIINTGFAGGFKAYGAGYGDIYFGEGVIFNHDRYFTEDDPYKKYCEGGFPVLSPSKILLAKLNAKLGQLSSGNSMLASQEDLNNMRRFKTVIKDMEAGAIAEAAFLMKVPLITAKIITDLVDDENCTQKQFNLNFPSLITKLENLNLEIISFYAGSHL